MAAVKTHVSVLYPRVMTVGQITAELFANLVLVNEVVKLDDAREDDNAELEVLSKQLVRHLGDGLLEETHWAQNVSHVH